MFEFLNRVFGLTQVKMAKGSDWIRLVFAHPFPLNNVPPVASANLISDGKVQVSPYGVASSYTVMIERAQLMRAPSFKTSGWAQTSPYPVSPFGSIAVYVYGAYRQIDTSNDLKLIIIMKKCMTFNHKHT